MSAKRRQPPTQSPVGDQRVAGAPNPPAGRARRLASHRRELVVAARRRLRESLAAEPQRWLLVDVTSQRLHLIHGGRVRASYAVSTAAAGLDSRQDSGGTPPGIHVIAGKIGDGMPAGTVFASRSPTGEIWAPADSPGGAVAGEGPRPSRHRSPEGGPEAPAPSAGLPDPGQDLILSRILTLAGREDGLNRGPGHDSLARHIYIHGTNDEQHIGQPVSHGCIRMRNGDVIDLFTRVQEGDPLVIV